MPTIKMLVSTKEECEGGSFIFEKDSKLRSSGDITYICGGCDRVMAEDMNKGQIAQGFPMFDPDCQTWSKVP